MGTQPARQLTGAATTTFQPAPEATDVDAATVHRWLENGEALLVDIREMDEFEMERIPGAVLLPGSVLDTESFPVISGLKIVLFCLTGRRSLAIAEQLLRAGFAEVYSLAGGTMAWRAAGFEIVDSAA